MAFGFGKKLAVVFGSGGARGWAHIGVLKALREMGVKPDYVAGTSIGSVVAAIVATGTLEKVESLAETLNWKEAAKLFVEFGMHRSGIIEGKRVMSLLGSLIPDVRIEDLDIPFAASSMDIMTQNEIVFTKGRLLDAVRASISIPGLFTPEHYGKNLWLVDGGLVNPLPVSVVRKSGDYRILAVDINLNMSGETNRVVKSGYSSPGARSDSSHDCKFDISFSNDNHVSGTDDVLEKLREFADEALTFAMKGFQSRKTDEPTILDVIVRSLRASENSITRERLLREKPDVLIQPAVGHIGTLEFHRSEEAINAGYEATIALRDKI